MDREVVQRLIYSIVQFLRNQLETAGNSSGLLADEGAESVEVALQCLETAYGFSQNSADLTVSRSLYDIFYEGVADEIERIPQSRSFNLGSAVPSGEDKEEAERLKNEGNSLMREEKFIEALECYTKAIAKDRSNAVYYCNRAASHSKLNNHKEAIEDCNRALSIEPQYSKAYGRMGLAYSAMDNARQAKECYQKALELEPENESYRGNLQIAEEKLRSQEHHPSSTGAAFNPFAALGGVGGLNLGALGNLAGGLGPGGAVPDAQGLFSNPALLNMATQLMQDPNIQNMMSSFLGSVGSGGVGSTPASDGAGSGGTSPSAGGGGFPGSGSGSGSGTGTSSSTGGGNSMEALLSVGRQIAEQMQTQHPELVEQLRSQMNRMSQGGSGGPSGSTNQDPPEPPHT